MEQLLMEIIMANTRAIKLAQYNCAAMMLAYLHLVDVTSFIITNDGVLPEAEILEFRRIV